MHTIIEGGVCSCGNPECRKPGKHPQRRHWQKQATADLNELYAIMIQGAAKIGVATGAKSGVIVVDVDDRHDGPASLAELERHHSPLPPTATVRTGNGMHLYFRAPDGVIVGNPTDVAKVELGKERTGIDVRGENGYVLAPPSRLHSGRMYAWEVTPEQTPPADMPAWLLALITAPEPTKTKSPIPAKAAVTNTWSDGDEPAAAEPPRSALPLSLIEPALKACSFMRHVPAQAPTLPESEWYKAASVYARCEDGRQVFHEVSRPHPGYAEQDADAKFNHAASAAGPCTCARIRDILGQRRHC